MYGPDSVFDVVPSDEERASWRRWDLQIDLEQLQRSRPRLGVARVLRALRVRR